MNKEIRTRIAPSPTGHFHLGLARTALFNYVFAKKYKGQFLIRIEDTDSKRSTSESEKEILSCLHWLGLIEDEPVIFQSKRVALYREYIQKLINNGNAYESKEEGGERDSVIRFKNPNKKIIFNDLIRGNIEIDTTDIGDFVIAKNLDTPMYHLAVVVDDFEMSISHVIRGEDHISNTPRQILIQEALGIEKPIYAHLPLILSQDKSKLSKRSGVGAVSIKQYKEKGYEKDALINFLALMGWHPKEDSEILDLKKIINEFNIKNIQKSGAIFDIQKLNYLNRYYLKKNPDINKKIESLIPNESILKNTNAKALRNQLILEKINVLSDITKLHKDGNEFDMFITRPKIHKESLIDKKSKPDFNTIKAYLIHIINTLNKADINETNPDNIKNILWDYATEHGRGEVLWPMRVALSGKDKSPDPFTLFVLLGVKESIERLKKAHDIIGA